MTQALRRWLGVGAGVAAILLAAEPAVAQGVTIDFGDGATLTSAPYSSSPSSLF